MFCTRCGASMEPSQRYCPACGAPVTGAAPSAPARSRIAGHARVLGILWIILSAYRLLPGMALLAIFSPHHWMMWPSVPFFVPGLLRIIGSLFMVVALLGLMAGIGLLAGQPWARMLAIVMGFVSLLEFPFGTALGIYTLWVLLPAGAAEEWRDAYRHP